MQMIKKVAAALFREEFGYEPTWADDDWTDDDWTDRFNVWIPKARAAIEAMREPTDAMVQAGIDEGDHKPGNWYPAMIEAALDNKRPEADA